MTKQYSKFTVHNEGEQPFEICVCGREDQTLRLLQRGPVTSKQHPGVRLSAYVHDLRGMGVQIATDYAPNGGVFGGSHGVYTLVSKVSEIKPATNVEAA